MADYSQILFWVLLGVCIIVLGFLIYRYIAKKNGVSDIFALATLMVQIFADKVVTPEEWDILMIALKDVLTLEKEPEIPEIIEEPAVVGGTSPDVNPE